jgi:hypothetical protein
MTLTARLLAFFFGTLVLVLAGFSGAVYWFAHDHLYQQAEERLASAMVTLSAAIEISEEGPISAKPARR